LVAGLCRVLSRRGLSVAPFKPQNMALNSAVTSDGGEIGLAQALQARACGLEPHTDMNPILLKPSSDTGAQVIVQGKALTELEAGAYHDYKKTAMAAVLDSYGRLGKAYQYVMAEGAGSPAEINLREGDIANMGFAEAVDCPVIIVADIDRGGVFAHLVGTLALLSESEQDRVAGFVINRFRGDIGLLKPGVDWLEQHTGKPVLGVLPYLHGLHLDAEDAVAGEQVLDEAGERLRVLVPVFSRISNHTDFDPLRLHPQVDLSYIGPGADIPPADLIILPGSKNVRRDLQWMRDNGWPAAIARHLRYGGKLLGICGGYQMLGRAVHDPLGVEESAGSSPGLGLFDMETGIHESKQLRQVHGTLLFDDARVSGYEIHCGETAGPALEHPAVTLDGGIADGAISTDGQIMGTYLHGLFDEAGARDALLRWAGLEPHTQPSQDDVREEQLERLATVLETEMDIDALLALQAGAEIK